MAMAQRGRHDLVLLDVMLPDVTGTEVCRRMRAMGIRTPVLFLTARDATEDKVAGLTVGGDDYVSKPFSLDELVARIHAVLRRTAGLVATDSAGWFSPTSRWTTTLTRCGARAS